MLNKKEILTGGLYTVLIAMGILAIAGFYRKSSNILQIVQYPDPVLRQTSEPIAEIDDTILSLTEDMVATLRYLTLKDFFLEQSVPRGLAAPQIGISKRLIVCGVNGKVKVMINPEILEKRGTYVNRDGCLSVRETGSKVIERSSYIKVKYSTLENEEEILIVHNDDAALVEHEIDHLNGVLNLDYDAAR